MRDTVRPTCVQSLGTLIYPCMAHDSDLSDSIVYAPGSIWPKLVQGLMDLLVWRNFLALLCPWPQH